MNRTVRNGLAIAGMAGGLWLLGNAVANADQTATAGNNVDQSSTSQGGGSANGNLSGASAENVKVTEVTTNVAGGNGGNNNASVNTGAITEPVYPSGATTLNTPSHPAPPPPTTISTGDATVNQQANGGSVSGSGNVNIVDNGGNQTATAINNVQQTATSTASDHHGRDNHDGRDNVEAMGPMGGPGGHGGPSFNFNASFANAKNVDVTRVETNVYGGNGGNNWADVNTGLIGEGYLPHHTNITTGDATVNQQANGGSVSNSGNVNIGPAAQASPCTCPQQEQKGKKHAAAPAAVMPAAKVSPAKVSPAVLSSAQPTAALATTGADYGMPLALGLIALAAGSGLTLAGRRRQTATV